MGLVGSREAAPRQRLGRRALEAPIGPAEHPGALLSFWDSLVVAAARQSGCAHLLTEDLQDGQDLGGTVVVNPFVHEPDQVR